MRLVWPHPHSSQEPALTFSSPEITGHFRFPPEADITRASDSIESELLSEPRLVIPRSYSTNPCRSDPTWAYRMLGSVGSLNRILV